MAVKKGKQMLKSASRGLDGCIHTAVGIWIGLIRRGFGLLSGGASASEQTR